MGDTDTSHRIETVDQLREIIGDCRPGLELKNTNSLDEFATDFIGKSPFLVLSTSNIEGQLDASPKGDDPGFVLVEDERTVVIPDRPGNRLVYGHQNILENPRVGLLFIVPGTTETLRINGIATLTTDPTLLERLASRGSPPSSGFESRLKSASFTAPRRSFAPSCGNRTHGSRSRKSRSARCSPSAWVLTPRRRRPSTPASKLTIATTSSRRTPNDDAVETAPPERHTHTHDQETT